jgi:hypothetical protein
MAPALSRAEFAESDLKDRKTNAIRLIEPM